MDAAELLSILWRRKLVLLLVTAGVVGAATWTFATAPRNYDSRAKIALLPDAANPQLVPFYGQAVESLLPTYAEIIDSMSFLEQVSADTDPTISPGELQGGVSARPVSQLGVLDVVGTSGDPERAQQMAQAVATALVERLEDNGIVTVTLLDEARLPTEPTAPSPTVVFAVALLVGSVLGGLGAVLADRFLRRVTTASELTDATHVPVLGAIPEMRKMASRTLAIGDPQFVDLEESLRSLRTNMLFAGHNSASGTFMITGLNPSDGKSTVAANMAVLIAELGVSVVLVDADLHRPVQHEIFGVSNWRGLTSLLDGMDIEDIVLPTKYENLRVVPSGPPTTSRAGELQVYIDGVRRLETLADVVIIDTPPLEAGDEVRILAAFADHVVVLVRSGSTTARDLRQSIANLELVGVELLGLVLSRSPERAGGDIYRQYRSLPDPDSRSRRARFEPTLRPWTPPRPTGEEPTSGSAELRAWMAEARPERGQRETARTEGDDPVAARRSASAGESGLPPGANPRAPR